MARELLYNSRQSVAEYSTAASIPYTERNTKALVLPPPDAHGTSCHAAVKLFFDRFRMGRTSIVFRSKAIVWSVGLLCF